MDQTPFEVKFFKQTSGKEPVREWLKELDPLVRNLKNRLWEVRTTLNNRIARVIFCTKAGNIVLLHGFIKKTQKTPKDDIALAKRRMSKL